MSSAIRRVRKSARRPCTAIAEASHRFASARLPCRAPGRRRRGRDGDPGLRAARRRRKCDGRVEEIARLNGLLAEDHELPALLRALDGRFIAPVAGGDLMRTPAILPTGRNLHGFDPYRIPSAFAIADGARQAERVLARHAADGHPFPESVAIVLWGTDNLKSEGAPIGQALALARRAAAIRRLRPPVRRGADARSTSSTGRASTSSSRCPGIFRDLLPLQIKAARGGVLPRRHGRRAARHRNFVRKHALAYQAEQRLRHGDRGACACSATPRAPMAPTSACWSTRALGATRTKSRRPSRAASASPTAARASAPRSPSCCRARWRRSTSPTRTSTASNSASPASTTTSTASAASAARSRARAAVRVGAGLYRRPDPRRGQGALARRTGRAGDPHPHAQSEMVRGHAQIWLRGRPADRGPCHQHDGWSATTGQVEPWVYEQITQTFVLDPEMRERLATLNPVASTKMTNRLIEAHERGYWTPDAETLAALADAGDELEDRLEGVAPEDCSMNLPIQESASPSRLVQVELDPNIADRHRPRCSRSMARAASARARPRPISPSRSPSSGKRVLADRLRSRSTISTFTLTKRLVPTVIDALEAVKFHSRGTARRRFRRRRATTA